MIRHEKTILLMLKIQTSNNNKAQLHQSQMHKKSQYKAKITKNILCKAEIKEMMKVTTYQRFILKRNKTKIH